jgi:hypothetical protein
LRSIPITSKARQTPSTKACCAAPSGYGATDDVEIFTLCQQGLAGGLDDWLILERGVDSESPDERGNYRGSSSDETLIRAFWREWRRLMASA